MPDDSATPLDATTRPAVTVVIPCHNHGAFVGEAVRSALAQRDASVRVVVVDDGSDDGSTPAACDRCAGPMVRVIHQPNAGLPAARNRGAQEAQGDFLVFLDADDWIEPDFVSHLHAALERERLGAGGSSAAWGYCQERLVGPGPGVWRVPEFDPVLLLLTNLHPVTALVRREAFEAVGGFTASMTRGYEDWDFWLKLAGRGMRGVRVREPLFVWRRHSAATMIHRVSGHHAALYAELMERHRAMYERHWPDLVARANALLRGAEMDWLDESGRAINHQALLAQREMYEGMLAVRLHHALHRMVARLPGPLHEGARRVMRLAARAWGGQRRGARPAPSDLPRTGSWTRA